MVGAPTICYKNDQPCLVLTASCLLTKLLNSIDKFELSNTTYFNLEEKCLQLLDTNLIIECFKLLKNPFAFFNSTIELGLLTILFLCGLKFKVEKLIKVLPGSKPVSLILFAIFEHLL